MNNTDLNIAREKFLYCCKTYIKRPGLDSLLEYLEQKTDFFHAPSSVSYHLNEEGGLVQHAVNVFECALTIYDQVIQPAIQKGTSPFTEEVDIESIAVRGLILLAMPQGAKAQKVEYRQSQSRLIEPQQQVFVRPLVVDLQVTTNERQKAVWPFPDVDITKMTVQDVDNLKINALYLTAQKFDADVIVAPTFDIRTVKKGIEITVIGFPAKYQNWKVATKEEDYKWIQDVYGTKIRFVNPFQSLGDNKAKNSDSDK